MNENNDLIIIELDKPRVLKLGHLVMKRFAAATKVPIVDMGTVGTRYDYISEMMYFMLNHDDPTLSRARVDELLDQVDIAYIMDKFNEALEAAFGEPDDDDNDDADPQTAAGTGTEA